MRGTLKPALRSSTDRNALVVENLGLVRYMVGKLWQLPAVRVLGVDDAIQIGNLALIRAAELWDESRGWTFPTYACKCICVNVYAAAGLGKSTNKTAQFNAKIKHLGSAGDYEILLPHGHGEQSIVDDVEELERCLKVLTPREKEILHMRHGLGMTLREIGQAIGVTNERVRQIVYVAMRKLRERVAS